MLSVASLFPGTGTGRARRARRNSPAREEEQRRLREAMQDLAETPRLVLALRYFESARPQQIALLLDIPEERIDSILTSAVHDVTEFLRRAESTTPPAAVPRRRVGRTSSRKVDRS